MIKCWEIKKILKLYCTICTILNFTLKIIVSSIYIVILTLFFKDKDSYFGAYRVQLLTISFEDWFLSYIFIYLSICLSIYLLIYLLPQQKILILEHQQI